MNNGRGVAQPGSALEWGSRGRWFKSSRPDFLCREVVVNNASINVGLLGWGTVGTGVSKILLNQSNLIEQNAGIQLRLIKIAKRTLPHLVPVLN